VRNDRNRPAAVLGHRHRHERLDQRLADAAPPCVKAACLTAQAPGCRASARALRPHPGGHGEIPIERVEDGRLAGRRCNTHTAARERGPGCVRLHEIGRSTRRGLAGANQFVMPRRIGGRELAPGRYVLIATPTARGKTGIALRVTFQVVL